MIVIVNVNVHIAAGTWAGGACRQPSHTAYSHQKGWVRSRVPSWWVVMMNGGRSVGAELQCSGVRDHPAVHHILQFIGGWLVAVQGCSTAVNMGEGA